MERQLNRRRALSACLGAALGAAPLSRVLAQQPLPPTDQPVFRVANRPEGPAAANDLLRQHADHPLADVLRWCYGGIEDARKIKDYTATFVKRERLNNRLLDPQYLFVKVRHEPFSVYTCFLKPAEKEWQEAIFVAGRNNNLVAAHASPKDLAGRLLGRLNLDPNGPVAMRDNKYPITNLGVLRMAEKFAAGLEADIRFPESEVQKYDGVKINGRDCLMWQVVHPQPRPHFRYHEARLFVDTQWNVPIRYESYDWPRGKEEQGQLIEEYTYLNLKVNAGLTDHDFDPANPQYKF